MTRPNVVATLVTLALIVAAWAFLPPPLRH